MSDVQPVPKGHEGMIAHLIVDGAAEAMDFYKKAFGAVEIFRMPAPGSDKLMHAEFKIGSNIIYLCDDFPEWSGGKSMHPNALGGTPVTLHQYVDNCDNWIARAEKAGAKVVRPAEDQFWGDRYGTVKDPFGYHWSFATHIKDLTPEEMAAATEKAMAGHK